MAMMVGHGFTIDKINDGERRVFVNDHHQNSLEELAKLSVVV